MASQTRSQVCQHHDRSIAVMSVIGAPKYSAGESGHPWCQRQWSNDWTLAEVQAVAEIAARDCHVIAGPPFVAAHPAQVVENTAIWQLYSTRGRRL